MKKSISGWLGLAVLAGWAVMGCAGNWQDDKKAIGNAVRECRSMAGASRDGVCGVGLWRAF
ncbi:MAG TPA: hypothetical protein VKP30_01995 [Polyangiaceae bacterium]|nr:hypothetical protein [Polyangiaceae bacterium]